MERFRMCIACREMKDKRELLRIVKDKEGNIFVDESGKQNGRGAYVCKSKDCIDKLQKQKLLNKTFKTNIDDAVYEKIKGVILG